MTEKDSYIELLNTVSESNNYLFVCLFITDVIKNGTYVLFSEKARDILEAAFSIKEVEQGVFLKGVVSRKKQILPLLMNELE